jgi:predicted 3-demethylubiquinone-9 3-methyltransferase (glyoxalase superfamily)
MLMQKIVTFLWLRDQAEEAANFYVSIFKNAKITSVVRYGDAGPGPKGDVMLVNFILEDQEFVALNGNTEFPFNHSVSLYVKCETQKEVDTYWEKLLAGGGKEIACGWLTDKFGLSWQITPTKMIELLQSNDPVKSQRVMAAMMKMVKLDIQTLQDAYDGK